MNGICEANSLGVSKKLQGWKMYSKIHQLKEYGLKKAQVARKLGINYKSVTKYWTMSPSDYQAYLEKTKSRKKKLDKYTDVILTLLNTHHDYTTSQIHDKLKERFPNESEAIVYSTLDVMLLNYLKKGKMNFIYRNYDEPINLDT